MTLGAQFQEWGPESEAQFTGALNSFRALLGRHPMTAKGHLSLAQLDQQTNPARALEHWHQALDIYLDTGENASALTALQGISRNYTDQQLFAEAIATLKKEERIQLRAFGKNANTADVLERMGDVYLASGQYQLASTEYARALERRSQLQGEQHPETLQAQTRIARAYEEQQQTWRARQVFDDALKRIEPKKAAQVYHDYALFELRQKRERRALELFDLALETQDELAPDHALLVYSEAGRLHAKFGQFDQALKNFSIVYRASPVAARAELLQEIASLCKRGHANSCKFRPESAPSEPATPDNQTP